MNRARGIALVAVIAMVLVACGRSNEGGGGGGGTPAGTPISSAPISGTIQVWAMGTEGQKLGVLAKDFEAANPGVTVKITAIPWDSAHDKIKNSIAGTPPDVSLIGTTWMGEFANDGALDETPSSINKDSFFPGAWNTTVVNGKSYGVPWYVETRVIYYRKDLAEKAGITSAPASWDDLKNMAKAMKEKAGAKWGISLQAGGTGSWQTIMPFVWQAGGGAVDDSGKNFTFDAAPNTEAYTYYKSFFTDKLSPTALDPGALEAGFINGSIGAFISGPWHIGILKDQGKQAFLDSKLALAVMPKNKAGTSFVGGGDLAVFKKTQNRDAAWRFVEYLSKPEVQAKWYETVSDLPAVQAGWDNSAISSDKWLPTFREQLKDAKAPPAIPNWEEVAAAFDTEAEKLCKTNETPEDAAKAIQQKATSIGTVF